MKKRVYDYYREELDYLRKLGGEFARSQPEVASLLDFEASPDDDPLIRRLVESFAFLTSRIRLKLDDDFPRICEAILEQLLPYALRPVPAFSIARFGLRDDHSDSTVGELLPRRRLFELRGKNHIRFCNAFDVLCWPIEIAQAKYQCAPFDMHDIVKEHNPVSKLQIVLGTQSEKNSFSDLAIEDLVFYVDNQHYAYSIHELIVNHSRHLVGLVASDLEGLKTIQLEPDDIEVTGLDENQTLLPHYDRGFFAHQLVSEFFLLPEKLLFFKLNLRRLREFDERRLILTFYFKSQREDLERQVDANTLRLGCSPVANLFDYGQSEIELDHFRTAYDVIPDKRLITQFEVYSISHVQAIGGDGRTCRFEPFFERPRSKAFARSPKYWHLERSEWPGDRTKGSLAQIALVNGDFTPEDLHEFQTVKIRSQCLNRELFNLKTARTQFGINADIPLEVYDDDGLFGDGEFLVSLTQAIPAPANSQLYTKLISHLNLNYLSLSQPDGDIDQEHAESGQDLPTKILMDLLDDLDLLRASDDNRRGSEVNRELVSLITGVRVESFVENIHNIKNVAHDLPAPPPGEDGVVKYLSRRGVSVCRGSKVLVSVDKNKIEDKAWFQLMCVLDRFFVHYATINSFTKLVVESETRGDHLADFSARCGRTKLI